MIAALIAATAVIADAAVRIARAGRARSWDRHVDAALAVASGVKPPASPR